ncbi:hypothetical protein ACWD26_07520 [Streptomyces sp. NPDC002787]
MATGGAPWPGAVLGLLPPGVLVTGCAESGATDGSAGARDSGSPSPSVTPPEKPHAKIVAHSPGQTLKRDTGDTGGIGNTGDTYGDHRSMGLQQSMGLPNGRYDILREVVDAARTERRRPGPAAERPTDRREHPGGPEWRRAGGPGDGPWQ